MSLPHPSPGTRAVVTGASSGIGEALAESLARRGHSLVLVARRADRLARLAERLSTSYLVEVDVEVVDLADRSQRSAFVERLRDVDVSVLCLNAGFATYGRLLDLDAERELEQVELNVNAVHHLLVALLPALVARGDGAVLITGSTAGNQPSPCNATYAATKAFANTLAESVGGELKGTGVSCTLLAPGPVRTEFAATSELGALERHIPDVAWVSAERAAESALRGLASRRRRVVPGLTSRIQDVGGRLAPRSLVIPMLHRVYGSGR